MNSFQVDLTNCDKEPIHIPGKVQSHGFLVAVNSKTHLITYISENIAAFINAEPKKFLGQHINELDRSLKITGSMLKLDQILKLGISTKSFENTNPFQIELDGRP